MKILSFDIEDWFHILDIGDSNSRDKWDSFESRIETGLNLVVRDLKDRNCHATFFILGWVAQKYPHLVKLLSDEGFHIASHSYSHELVYKNSRETFRDDLARSLDVIENITNTKVDCYRAPGFSVTEQTCWYIEELVNQGIKVDSSIFPAARGHGGFPSYGEATPSIIERNGLTLKEFPINCASFLGYKYIFSWGGYFRLFPEWLLNYHFRHSDYTMTYFHLRDFDDGQSRLPMNFMRSFKSYYGLSGAWQKYLNIVDRFEFCDLRTADQEIDWPTCKIVNFND